MASDLVPANEMWDFPPWLKKERCSREAWSASKKGGGKYMVMAGKATNSAYHMNLDNKTEQ